MSMLNPQDSEDELAWIPVIGCVVPLVIFIALVAYIAWRVFR